MNILEKEQISAVDLHDMIKYNEGYQIFPLDVRSDLEYNRYHIKGSLHIHIEDLSIETLKKAINYNKDEKYIIITYCNSGGRGGRSFTLLKETNTNSNILIKNLTHGINEWINQGYKIEENL